MAAGGGTFRLRVFVSEAKPCSSALGAAITNIVHTESEAGGGPAITRHLESTSSATEEPSLLCFASSKTRHSVTNRKETQRNPTTCLKTPGPSGLTQMLYHSSPALKGTRAHCTWTSPGPHLDTCIWELV